MNTLALTLLFAGIVATMTAAATSLRSVGRIWLRHWAELHATGETEQAGSALDRPHRYLLAAGTGIAAITFALGATLALREDRTDLVRGLVVAAIALLLIGQVLPRAISRRWSTHVVAALMPLLGALDTLFGPILAFAGRAVRSLLPQLPAAVATDAGDPLEDLLREAELEGIGAPAESEIISGVVEFGEKRVRDVMMPRDKVTLVDEGAPAASVAETIARSKYTRIPVTGRAGEVIGLVHAFDVLVHPATPLATIRPVSVATADEPCGTAMRRMLRERRHLATVRDDANAFVGIVTLEDLVEELVGDIRDEHDEPPGAGA